MKVQIYQNLKKYIDKSEDFLLRKEVSNNLFWELFEKLGKLHHEKHWAANVMNDGKIEISAILTPSGYLMLSNGNFLACNQLLQYFNRKKLILKGVAGPSGLLDSIFQDRTKIENEKYGIERNFKIFESPNKLKFASDNESNEYKLKEVTSLEWPRIRLWALQFAHESIPALNGSQIVLSAKKMMQKKSLFIVQKEGVGSCGMAGFGRETRNFKVINLVYVPDEYRSRGVGKKLINQLLEVAKNRFHKKCLLFSDYLGKQNLYQSMGFRHVSNYREVEIN